jgi:TrmH family RNA methyltransferase
MTRRRSPTDAPYRPPERRAPVAGAPQAPTVVTSLTNPLVKDIRALALKKERERTGLFIAEGLKLVMDALEAGWTLTALVAGTKVADHPATRQAIRVGLASGARVIEVSDEVLEKIARRDNPQTVIGVFEQRFTPLAALDPRRQTTLVALEGVKDPGNLGTVIRTADAAGASAVVLVGETTDPFGVEAVRATMGSIFAVPIVRASMDDMFAYAKRHKLPVVGTHLKGAIDHREVGWREPGILLMGNEKAGLPEDAAARCDALVKIAMSGQADSLNLSIATAIVLFEARRAHLKL